MDVLRDEMRQHEAVVQLRAPAHQRLLVGLLPEPGDQRAQQQHLRQAHPRMRRHFEGAEFQQAEAAGRAVGRIEFVDAEFGAVGVAGDVDQQIAQQAVDQPGRRGSSPRSGICWKAISSSYRLSLRASSTRGAWLVGPMNMPREQVGQARDGCCQ